MEDSRLKVDSVALLDQSFKQYLREEQRASLDYRKIPGASIHVVKDSLLYFRHLYGVRNIDSIAPVTEKTVF